MENIDLHNHSRVSDGLLSPTELVRLAASNGVTTLSLTDHDDVGGLAEARLAAVEAGIVFINGVEISVSWGNHTVHVVGLNIDPTHHVLVEGLLQIRQGRVARAKLIGDELAKVGIAGAFEGALKFAQNPNIIARPHFARYIVEQGHAKNVSQVFKRYLIKGKPGFVRHRWADLSEALHWIRAAQGIPVLAHPGRYEMGKAKMESLLDEFVEFGGLALEVVTSNHNKEEVEIFAQHVRKRNLLASRGSDFHGPGESFCEPGKLPELPYGCKPVWQMWSPPSTH
ncbi:MAG: phosphatase [Ferrovum sp. 34-44-207]|nr:MAG: phosphatase [Ferrovum sp. 21-44-67]OZB33812.1 MAG: phosphatase [Ferrovum sp. 34-44-207]HQU05929.1 3',5'-nucleoside bisphosphate phosphatase [Ferrovaceae bacterium]